MRWLLSSTSLLVGCSFQISALDPDAVPGDATDAAVELDAPQDPACASLWQYVPSNFDPCEQGLTIHPPLTLPAGTYAYTPETGVLTKDMAPFATLTTSGTSTRLLSLAGLTIDAGAIVQIEGTRPLIIGVHGDVVINGALSVSAIATASGPGGGACAGTTGSNATQIPSWSAGGGGGGGGFGSIGAAGGTGDTQPGNAKTPGGPAMPAEGSDMLVPLRGGCLGGTGGEEDPRCTSPGTPGVGGGAGGAIQLSARGALVLGPSTQIAANGGGGSRGINGTFVNGGWHVGAGAGGGGSGGAILLEAMTMAIAPAAFLCANGGGGGGGSHNNDQVTSGTDAACASSAAAGGNGSNGNGGPGAFGSTDAMAGTPGSRQDDGGGGGGGGVGRIRVRAAGGTSPTVSSSPPARID